MHTSDSLSASFLQRFGCRLELSLSRDAETLVRRSLKQRLATRASSVRQPDANYFPAWAEVYSIAEPEWVDLITPR